MRTITRSNSNANVCAVAVVHAGSLQAPRFQSTEAADIFHNYNIDRQRCDTSHRGTVLINLSHHIRSEHLSQDNVGNFRYEG